MEASYETLLTVFSIVKNETSPETYLCSAHEIILRHSLDWPTIQIHLAMLEKEGLVTIKQLDKMAISLSADGVKKARALKNNFVVSNFSFSNEKPANSAEKLSG